MDVAVGTIFFNLNEPLLLKQFKLSRCWLAVAGCWLQLVGWVVQHQRQPANPSLPNRWP
jgi:hypothetical protein